MKTVFCAMRGVFKKIRGALCAGLLGGAPFILNGGNLADVIGKCDSELAKSGELIIGASVCPLFAEERYGFISSMESDLSGAFPKADVRTAFEKAGVADVLNGMFEKNPSLGLIAFYVHSGGGDAKIRILDMENMEPLRDIRLAGISEGAGFPPDVPASIVRALNFISEVSGRLDFRDLSGYANLSNKLPWSVAARGKCVSFLFSPPSGFDGGGLKLVLDADTGRIFKMEQTR